MRTDRERPRPGPAHGRRRPHRGRDPARHGRGPARRRRRGPRAAPWSSPPAAWARCSRRPPTRRCPPATAWRSRCAPAPRSPTWSSSSSTRPCCSSAPDAEGQQPLVSEAVRGEGAHLVDADGDRFMLGQHELAELAPRDIVAKAIMRRMQEQGAEHMCLDARHFGAEMWEHRFPTILAACRAHGIDPVTEPIPVAPAAHYASGGVRTDLRGRTTVPGLYACGEVACTGVHGANRLASNSLLEGPGLRRAHRRRHRGRCRGCTGTPRDPAGPPIRRGPAAAAARPGGPGPHPADHDRRRRGAALRRQPRRCRPAALEAIRADEHEGRRPGVEAWEATNLLSSPASWSPRPRAREETRGCHWREDLPDRDDAAWRRHLVVTPHAPSGPWTSVPRPAPTSPTVATPREPYREHARGTPSPAGGRPLIPIGAPARAAAAATTAARRDAERVECGLDPALAALLAASGLDPVLVEDIAHLAIEEDLDGGVDVTSVGDRPRRTPSPPATSPPAQAGRSRACASPRRSSPSSAPRSSRSSGTPRTATASPPARSCSPSPPAPATC